MKIKQTTNEKHLVPSVASSKPLINISTCYSLGLQLTSKGEKKEGLCVYRLNTHTLEIFITSPESACFIRLKASYWEPFSSHAQHPEHSPVSTKDAHNSCFLPLGFRTEPSSAAWWLSLPTSLLEESQPGLKKHFPYFGSSFSPRLKPRSTRVSVLHLPHKGILSSGALKTLPWRLPSCPTLLLAYLGEE